jgi:hypothetical protein
MKLFSSLVGAILISSAGLTNPLSAATVVYTVSDVLGPVTLGGTITTDGTIGSLSVPHIIDFDVTFTTANGSSQLTKSTVLAANFVIAGTALTATSSGLFFDFSGSGRFNIFSSTAHSQWLMCASDPFFCTPINNWFVNGGGKSNVINGETADVEIAIGPPEPTATTPLPAALPLFAGGLGALGLLGWRRKWRHFTAD